MELQLEAPRTLVSKPARVLSVDVLRGLVMFTMVFVNDSYGASGSPWWLKHWDALEKQYGKNGMTFVDLVFPAFLFIVGMSVPLAIENRRAKGDGWLKIYGHILLRAASLIFLGVLMVNNPSDATMGWTHGLWNMLFVLGAIVGFHSLPLKNRKAQYISLAVRCVGLGLLVFLAIKFRDKNGNPMDHDWWGILGLIGWAYFGTATFYCILRKEGQAALVAVVALFFGFYFADMKGSFHRVHDFHFSLFGHNVPLGYWFGLGEAFGTQAAITMMGVVVGSVLLPTSIVASWREKVRFAVVFAALMCVGAVVLNKFGISKNDATPSWCLWSATITTALWVVLYLIVDVAGWRAWSIPLAWAGASALLIYILSEGWDVYHEHFSWLQWQWYDNLGDKYPQSLQHKFLTAGALSLIGGVLGRIGFKLKL